ncbi:6984_t:CDS:2 [Rhizophagus irregularis]|nr:6984_t:CDS:2 [Rhizophagus irregularis]
MSMSDIESMSSDGSDSDLSTEEFLENIPDERVGLSLDIDLEY